MKDKVKVTIKIEGKTYEHELPYDIELLDIITIGDILDIKEAKKELKSDLHDLMCPFYSVCRLANNKCYGRNILLCNIFHEMYNKTLMTIRKIIYEEAEKLRSSV